MDQNTEPVIDTEAALAELVDRGLVEVVPGDDPDVDYDDCAIGACAQSTYVQPARGKRPEMTFWDASGLIDTAAAHGLALKVTARTCTLIDRAIKTAKEHTRRTGHTMLGNFHYESLPGRVHGTEIVVVDAENVSQANVRPGGLTGWTFVAPEPTITADVAQIRADAACTFRVDGDEDLPSGITSTGDKLDVDLSKNHPDADARVLRVLAARIARAGTTNEDSLLTLTDLAAALRSLNVAVAHLGGAQLSDEDDPESFKIYAETLDHLRHAADGVAEIAGWI